MRLGNQVHAPRRVLAASRLAPLGFVLAVLLATAQSPADEAAPAPPGSEAAAPSSAAGHAAGISEAERDRQAEAISRSIMSPFCPGRTVSSCPNAGPWRDDIRKWVGEGVDAAEIKRRLAARAPEHDLAGIPKNRLGWVLPVGLGVGAFGLLVFLLRYLVGRPAVGSPAEAGKASTKPESKSSASKNQGDDDDEPPPPGASKSGKDWDAQLDRELDSLDNN